MRLWDMTTGVERDVRSISRNVVTFIRRGGFVCTSCTSLGAADHNLWTHREPTAAQVVPRGTLLRAGERGSAAEAVGRQDHAGARVGDSGEGRPLCGSTASGRLPPEVSGTLTGLRLRAPREQVVHSFTGHNNIIQCCDASGAHSAVSAC